jgi:DNA/RNA-binding domain of Phe-tRNA-synthetase-like protein
LNWRMPREKWARCSWPVMRFRSRFRTQALRPSVLAFRSSRQARVAASHQSIKERGGRIDWQGMGDSGDSAIPQIAIELPGVRLAVVLARSVTVSPASAELEREIAALCARLQREIALEQLAEREPVQAVRSMFRGWGVDPTHSRPSGEQLLRRVLQGKGLYRVSNVVDLNNLGSCETGWPWGSFDLDRLLPPIMFRHGRTGESYLAIGKEMWSVEGKPVLCDAEGPFGGPIRDSQRSMITAETHRVLTVIFAPSTAAPALIERAAEAHAKRLAQFAGAASTHSATLNR